MMAGWESKPLGELLLRTETTNPTLRPDEEFDYIDVSCVSNVTHEIETTQRLMGRDAPSRARRLVRSGDVLFATIRPTLQRIAVVPPELDRQVCSTGYFVLRPCNEIEHRFLFYSLFTEQFMGAMEGLQKGASYPAVTDAEVRAQLLSYPPLPEQQRIVAILDEAFEGIATAKANAEKNLQNARQVVNWQLEKVFTDAGPGWIKKRLQDVCERITDGTHQTPTYYNQGVVFLSSRNVTSGKIDWDNIKYIDTKQHLEMHRRVAPRVDDILLAKNGTTGIAAMVDRDVVFDIYVSLALIRPLACVLPAFLLHFINSPVAKHQFNKRLKGVGVPNLHLQEIREVLVTFPESQQEQEKVVKRLDALQGEVGNLTNVYKRKLSALDELKKSLLHQAFTGQL